MSKSRPTETLSKDYAATAESLSAILQKELTCYSCKGYLNSSDPSTVTATDRKALVDWCYGVVDHCQLPRETVAIAMEMVDRFLSISAGPSALWNVNSDVAKVGRDVLHCKSKFQLLTVAALKSSLEAKDVMISSDQIIESCSLYTREEIETMEHSLLRGLSWRSNTPTPCKVGRSILSLLLHHVNLPEATWGFFLDEMHYQTEVAVRDYYFSTKRPSTIAMAAIFSAIECTSSKAHQDMLNTCLSGICECFNFDHNDLVNVARMRLQRHLRGESMVDEEREGTSSPKTPQRSPFSVDFLEPVLLQSLDNFMKNFSTNSMNKTTPPPPLPASSAATVSPDKNLKKPKRPLTAYHIYLAIEREFIIQSIPGEDADKSIHDGKVYLDYVPERYRQIKLSPDWYLGPDKRKRRKHRKQHGKIGFKELTTIISERWADLDKTNPDIKIFVQNLAERELIAHRREMAEYEKQVIDTATPTENKSISKRALDSDVVLGDSSSSKPQKKPRWTHQGVSLLSAGTTAVEKECLEETTQPIISNELKAFQYRPITRKNIKSNRQTDEGVKQYHRRISLDDWQGMPDNPPSRVVSVDGFD